jgi:hypothetical protein
MSKLQCQYYNQSYDNGKDPNRPVKSPNGRGKGWQDKNGNVWVPAPAGSGLDHGGEHWDVQELGGNGYTNVYPGGKRRPGKGKEPKLPPAKTPQKSNFTIDKSKVKIVALVGLGLIAIGAIIFVGVSTGGAGFGLLAFA